MARTRAALLLVALALLAACARQPAAEGSAAAAGATPLRGTYWRLVEVDGAAAVASSPGREPHLRLAADSVDATGSTGCNRFRGRFELAGERLTFGPLTTTRMACLEEALNRQEQAYARALAAVDRAAVDGGTLRLYAGERVVARFVAAAAPPSP